MLLLSDVDDLLTTVLYPSASSAFST